MSKACVPEVGNTFRVKEERFSGAPSPPVYQRVGNATSDVLCRTENQCT